MFKQRQRITSILVAGSIALSGIGLGSTAAVAAEPRNSSSTSSDSGSPVDLPVRDINDVKSEATAKNLDPEAINFAVGLQQIINAYHQLPPELQNKPTDDPAVKQQLDAIIVQQTAASNRSNPGLATAQGITPVQAGDCALAIADAVSIAVPGANAWKWIKAAGGAITVAEAVSEYLQSKSEDALIKVIGKTAGQELKKVLGVKGVIDSCNFG